MNECKIFSAKVTKAEKRTTPKPHIVYKIDIKANIGSWFTHRRYSEFEVLHSKVVEFLSGTPSLPPKEKFKSGKKTNSSIEFIEKRKSGLDTYLQFIINSPNDQYLRLLFEFLGVNIFAKTVLLQKQRIQSLKSGISFERFILVHTLLDEHGSLTNVMKVRDKKQQQMFAMRSIEECFALNILENAQEIRNLNCSLIVPPTNCFLADENWFCIKNFIDGKPLNQLQHYLNEISMDEIKYLIAQIIVIVECLHSKDLLCMDIALDKLILCPDGKIRYSCWRLVKECEVFSGRLSFYHYLPLNLVPEIQEGGLLSKASDWWLVGLIIFQLTTKTLLHQITDQDDLFLNQNHLDFFGSLPEDAISLIKGLLNEEVEERLGSGGTGAEEVKSHPFFQNIDWNVIEDLKTQTDEKYV